MLGFDIYHQITGNLWMNCLINVRCFDLLVSTVYYVPPVVINIGVE